MDYDLEDQDHVQTSQARAALDPADDEAAEPRPGARMLALVPFVILGAAGLGLVSLRTQMGQSFTREPLLLVDPNVASAQDLEALPEIGQGTARSIVKERARGGRFRDVRDFERRVDGIGPRTMELLAPHLRFEESP